MIRLAPIAANLPATVPFIGPETLERQRGHPFRARLGANENGFGPSTKAVAAMQASVPDVWKYADATSHDLTHALSAHLGIAPDHFTVGEGIDGLLGNLVRLVVAPGDAVVTSDGAYPTFNYHVTGFGGILHKVPYRNDAEDPQALTARAHETGARLIYLANPDNPMGSWLSGMAIQAMLDDLPPGCLLLLDEAYCEFAPASALPDIAPADPRVIRMRTFSKAYGMAGARVGYAFGNPDLIAAFDRVRNHFGLCRISQIGALAALQDQDWLNHIRDQVASARQRIADIGAEHGLTALPSATNFVALDTGRDGSHARALVAALDGQGVFVRMPGVAPLNRCIRVSCGPATDLEIFAKALPRALATL